MSSAPTLPLWITNPQAFLRSLGATGLPILLWQTTDSLIHCNAAFARMLGDEASEWATCRFEQLIGRIHPDERRELALVMAKGFGGGLAERSFEVRLGHKSGQWISASVALNALSTNAEGKAERLACTFIDVTTSRLVKEQWRTRAELASDWFWETNVDQCITVMADGTASELKIDLTQPNSAKFHHDPAIARALSAERAFSRLKFSVINEHGTTKWYELDGRPIYDAHSEWRGFEGVGRDVSQREVMVQEAQSTVATLDAVVDSIPIPMFVKDTSQVYTKVNEPFRQLVGLTDAKLIGQRADALFDADTLELHETEDQRVLEHKAVLKYEVQQHFPSVGVVDALIRKAPIVDSQGNVLGLIGMVVDVTSQREIERNLRRAKDDAEAASLSKSSFLATMSHEIRTPMNGVLGMAEMLSKDQLSDDQAEAVGIIRQSATNLLTLIDDILDFSKIDSGKVDLEQREVDVASLIGSLVESLTPLSLGKSVRLRSFIGLGVPALIRSDDTRIRQVLTNLVGNAIKFSAGREGVKGDVYLRVTSNDGEAIRFDVIDNGIGIAAEHLPKMFNAFTQAERSTTRRYGGTGLGLAISHKLATMLGGTLEVTSEPGIGSEFTLKIPMCEAQGECTRRLVNLNSITCILLDSKGVPDNDLGVLIRASGATVRRAKTVEQAQEFARQANGRSVLIASLREKNERDVARDLQSKSWPNATYHLLLTEGLRKSLRMLAEKVACIDIGQIETVIKAIGLLTSNATTLPPAAPAEHLRSSDLGLATEASKAVPALGGAVANGTYVLVAEDDPINQRVISRQLKSLGVQVDLASNGQQALEMWRAKRSYHAIITDMHMPEMDGYAFASAVRAEEKDSEHVPILALTANAINGESFEAFQAGIDVYLTKPILLNDLANALAVYSSNSCVALPGEQDREPDLTSSAKNSEMSFPVFDKQRFAELVGNDEDIMAELMEGFFDEGAKLVDEISVQLYRNKQEHTKGLAHRLKSAARSVGALSLGELATQIELQADKLLMHEAQALAVRVQKEFEELARVVKLQGFSQAVAS